MTDENTDGHGRLAAGDFASWIEGIERVIRDEVGSEVPCAGCTACCRSRQFVPVAPDELDTLARIRPELLFPAPRMPEGHLVLGYDERGHCPMLVDDRCSIYDHRPRACRAYDCRIFTAAGVEVGAEQAAIARRVEQWQFTFPSDDAVAEHQACRSAAVFLDDHRELWPDVAPNPTGLATSAVAIHGLFVGNGLGSGHTGVESPDRREVGAELARWLGRASTPTVEDPAATVEDPAATGGRTNRPVAPSGADRGSGR